MPKILLLTANAELDIEEAFNWYESQDQGLGKSFIRCLDSKIDSIHNNPLHFQIVQKPSIRRALVNRFPFSIYYINQEDLISIIAVLHQHRSPESWKNRT